MLKKIIMIFLLIIFSFSCVPKKKKINNKIKINKIIENIENENEKIETEFNNISINIISSFDGLISDNIKAIEISKEYIWACGVNGLSCLNKDNGKIINYAFTNGNLMNFSSFNDNSFLVMANMGVYIFTNKVFTLLTNLIFMSKIIRDDDNLILLSKKGYLYNFNSDNLKIKRCFTNINNIENIYGNDKHIFIKRNNKLISLKDNKVIISNFQGNFKVFSYKDNIYLASDSLIKIELNNGDKHILMTLSTNKFITDLYIDDYKIFIGTTKGLIYFNSKYKKRINLLQEYKIRDSYIQTIKKDENSLWLGTKQYGLINYIFIKKEL